MGLNRIILNKLNENMYIRGFKSDSDGHTHTYKRGDYIKDNLKSNVDEIKAKIDNIENIITNYISNKYSDINTKVYKQKERIGTDTLNVYGRIIMYMGRNTVRFVPILVQYNEVLELYGVTGGYEIIFSKKDRITLEYNEDVSKRKEEIFSMIDENMPRIKSWLDSWNNES